MGFIQDNKPQGRTKESRVLGTTEHVLQHGVVCYENIRNAFPRFFSGPPSARLPTRFAHPIRVTVIFGSVAGEVKESRSDRAFEPLIEPCNLIGYKRVH